MRPTILKPKLTLNAEFTPSHTTHKSLRLDTKSQQNLDAEPTPRALTSRLPSYDLKPRPSRNLDSYPSIDAGLGSPSNQAVPGSTTSMTKIPVTSPASTPKIILPPAMSKSGSLATNYVKNTEKILNDIPEEPQLTIETRPMTNFGIATTERTERTSDYFGVTTEMPPLHTARTGTTTTKMFNFKTIPSWGFDRFRTEEFEESVFEKNIIEKGTKTFAKKINVLNFAEMRKTFVGPKNYSHDFRNFDSFTPALPKPRSRPYSRVNSGTEADHFFFLTERGPSKDSAEGSDIENHFEMTVETVEVAEDQPNNISLQKSAVTYCKISVMDKYSPLSISISGAKNIKRLRTFVSVTNPKPSKLNCDDKYEARNVKVYEKNRSSPRFLNPYIYLALLPNDNGVISLKLEFAQKKPLIFTDSKKQPNKPIKKGYVPEPINLPRRDIFYEIGRIKKERKEKMMMLSNGIDKIEFNKNTEQYIPTRACERREMLKMKSEDNFRMAQSRKAVIDQEKLSMRKANMMRHDLQKIIKEIASVETHKVMVKRFILEKWLVNIFFCQLGDSIKTLLRKEKIAKARRDRIAFALSTFSARMRSLLSKKGETGLDRFKFDIKMALQLHANVIQHNRMHEVSRVVISFLKDNMVLHYLKNKFLNTTQAIKKVQTTYRTYLRRKEGFKTCMLVLWDKNYMKIYHECMQVGSSGAISQTAISSTKPVLRKLQSDDLVIIDAARKKFVKMWYKRCLVKYKKNYHVHHLEIANLTHEERQQWHLQYMFMKSDQKEKEIPLVARMKQVSKVGLMEEFKKNRIAAIDYTESVVSHKQKLIPPRLFMLPNQEELDEVIREAILMERGAVK